MGLLDELNKDAKKVEKTAKKATKKAKKTVKKASDTAQHTVDSVNKASKKTAQDIANTTSKTIDGTNKVVNQAIQGVTATSEEFLKRSGQLVSTKLEKNTIPFDTGSVAHFATTAERIAVEFEGEVKGEATSVCLVIDRTAENTMDAASNFLANIAKDLESLLNWIEHSALFQPITNTLIAALNEIPNAIEFGSNQITSTNTKQFKQEIDSTFDSFEKALGARKKAPPAGKTPKIHKPSIPKIDNPLEKLIKEKMCEIQADHPDILGLENFFNKYDDIKFTFHLDDLLPSVDLIHIIPQIIGQLETIIKEFDPNNPGSSVHQLEAIVQDNLIDVLDSFKDQLSENVDKSLVYISEHADFLIKLWKEPLHDIPFFSDFYQNKLQVPLTAGTLISLMPAIQLTFSCMLENGGAQLFSTNSNSESKQNSSPTMTSKNIEIWRSITIGSSYLNITSTILSDLLKFDCRLRETGNALKASYTFSSFSLFVMKLIPTILKIHLRSLRIKSGEISEEESTNEGFLLRFTVFDLLTVLVPFFLQLYSINKLRKSRKNDEYSDENNKDKYKYKPDDATTLFNLAGELVGGFVSLGLGVLHPSKSTYAVALNTYSFVQILRSLRHYYYFSFLNSEEELDMFISFKSTPEWKIDQTKIDINEAKVNQVNKLTVPLLESLYMISLQKPIRW